MHVSVEKYVISRNNNDFLIEIIMSDEFVAEKELDEEFFVLNNKKMDFIIFTEDDKKKYFIEEIVQWICPRTYLQNMD